MGDKTPAHSATSKISVLWESFVNSEPNSPERESWLDLFLGEALLLLKDGKTPVEILSLSGKDVGSILCEEIVRGVEGTCKSDTNPDASTEDDLAPLRDYLLCGPGWRAIALLHQLGIQEVGEELGKELARVLMCVYNVVCSPLPEEATNEYLVIENVQPVDQICKFRLPGRHKSRSNSSYGSSVSSLPSSLSKPRTNLPRHFRKLLQNSRNDSSSEEELISASHRNLVEEKGEKTREHTEFDPYLISGGAGVHATDEGEEVMKAASSGWGRRRRAKPCPEDVADWRTHLVIKSSCPGSQLALVTLSLLQGICRVEPTPAASVQIVTFCLEALCSLQFGTVCRPQLQATATRLLLTALDKLLSCPDSTLAVLQTGALPMMLRLLEDSISKAQKDTSDPELQQDFIYGVTYAVVNFIHSLVLQCPSPERMDFETPFQQYLDSYNGRLIECSVGAILSFKTLNDKMTLNRAKKIIGLVGQLVNCLKQTRTRFVHMRVCRRGKHKSCKVSNVIHHHEDVLGEVYKQTVLPGANRYGCRITAVSMSLARFISESGERELALRAMAAMMECGTCCCFPAQGLIARILRLVQTGDSRARNTGLMLLERTIYKEVGALEDRRCVVCCDKSAAVSKHRWAGLQAFQDMLMSSNIRVAHTVASHLMRVAPRCITNVQKELLFSVFYPAFLASKKNFCESKMDRDKFTLITCLSAFTNLLGKMRFACEFLERDGLRHVMDLTRHRDFERLACTILEIVTIVRLWKLGESAPNAALSPESVPELDHLTSLIVNTSNHFLTSLKKWQNKDNPDEGVSFRSASSLEKYTVCLEELNTYWSSCLNLCLFSPQVQAHSTRHLSIHAYTLLTFFIQHIIKPFTIPEDDDQETSEKYSSLNQLHLELLESLITITTLCPYSGNPGGVKCLEGKLEKVAKSRLGLRPVCDVLLRSSGANPTDKLMLPVYPMPKLNSLDVSLAATLVLEDGNSDTSLDSSEDEGYDGDIELTNRHNQDKDSMSNKGSLPPSRKISALGERRYKIVHPSLCHLALDLIVYCHKKEGFKKECIYCLHKLSSAIRDSCHNALILVQSGFGLALLQNFSELLSNKSQQDIELQTAVLELFSNLARYCLQPDELAMYLQLFVSDQPPVDLLLSILLKLMKGTTIQPKYILCFPAEYSNADLVNSTQAHKMAITLHHQHLSLDVVSCWSRGALFLPLNCDLSWAMWVQGFALALWLKLDNPLANVEPPHACLSESSCESVSGHSTLDEVNLSQLLHIISIGYEALVLEFWADTVRNILHVRLTRSDGGCLETLSEASLEGTITCGSWHHLSISVRDSVHNSKVIIEVTLVVDGWCEIQIPLSFKGLLVRKSRPTCVIVGDTDHVPISFSTSPESDKPDTEKSRVGTWELGNILMFRKPLLGKEESSLLWALGPDICLVSCQAGQPLTVTSPAPNHDETPTLLSPDVQSSLLKTMQESMLMSFSARESSIMNIYPQVSGSTGVGGGFRVVVGGDNDSSNNRSSQQVPMTLPLVTLTSPAPQIQCDILTAIDTLGGPALILFLFARVVELESSEKEQGAALELFLRMATSYNHQIKSEAMALVPLVSRVIDTPLCTPGLILLQTVVDCCCQGDVLVYPELLVGLLLEWPAPWAASHALDSLLQTLLSLTRDDHRHREFNSNQLNRANALYTLLNLCKERMLEGLALSVELCRGVVEVVRSLMTAPPLLSHVSSLSDYLLLSHPAHLTFISHTRQSLSFLLPADPPSSKSHPSRKKGGIFSADKAYRSLFTKPIDPTKLNQALNNLKEKGDRSKRRRIRVSSGSAGEEIAGKCDSGFAASSLQGTATDSDQNNARDVDEWSNTSANTYFTSNAQNFELEDADSSTQESSVVTSDNDENSTENNSYVRNKIGWRRGSIGNGEVELVVGLLEVVRDQLLVLPDSVAHCPTVMSSLVNPHSLIAMANHTNHHIVSAVVKVLAAYWERVNNEERSRFISDRFFYLLAMQLPQSLANSGGLDLVEGLAGIVTGYHRSQLSHQVMQLSHDFATGGSQSLTLAALPPLLALIPSSVTHIPTAHNLISFVHSLFIKVGDWKSIVELGLVEATLKALVRTVHEHDENDDDLCIPERNVLIADINSLLSTVISHAIHASGSHFAQVVSEVLLQVEFVSNSERENCGLTTQCSLQVRRTHASILRAAILALSDCISSHSTKASFLSSVYFSVMSVNSDEAEIQSTSSGSSNLSYSGKLSRSDLNERYKLIISRSTEFFIHNEPNLLDDGGDFVKEVWGAIVQALVAVIERKSMHTRSAYSNVAWSNRDVLRTLGSQMFLWMLSPAQPRELQFYGIQSILNEPRSKDILSYIISTALVEESVALYLWEMGKSCTVLNDVERKACEEMSTRLEEWCSPSVLSLFNSSSSDQDYSAHVWSALDLSTRTRNTWRAQRNNMINKIVYRHEDLGRELGERAMSATRQVVSQQSVQRKRLMQRLKEGFGACVQATIAWRRLVSDLTHPRAVFYFPNIYPNSWELDPTEGPSRVRVRMRRTHLDINSKFFKPEFAQNSCCDCGAQTPLGYLFEDSRLPLSAVVVERLHSNIKVRHMCQASLITPHCQTQGELLIANSAVYFVPSHHDHSQMVGGGCENVSQEWSLDQIKEIHRRRFELQERAIEIFLQNGRTHLVALNSTKERDEVMECISGAELGSRVASEPLTQAVELWRDGALTNWQYLIILNTMAGRTYNDLMQYPVFPFVLADYTSQKLDLTDPKSYRNFKKPMAIQDKKNEQHYIKHYNYLKGEMAKGSLSHPQEPYHYSSHYSNSVTVLHFLVRMPPYTAMFLKYQDESFDWPDRTFHSMQTTWRLTSSESTTDVKELIPEFFFLPEFLNNNEGFDFGLRQSGDPVDDVILPPWANDPRTFILIHRQALESEYCRENLPHWIDLVFGYKQVGKAAVDCINVFHPATYYGFDPERVTDPLSRLASYTMVRTYGQTPKQLFRANPHPLPVQPLEGKLSPEDVPPVIPGVRGLVWGRYVGSPSDSGGAKLVWQHQAAVSSLVPLQTNDIFGLPPATTLLLSHTKDTPLPLGSSAAVHGAAVVSWGHGDGVIRAKVTKDHPPVPIIPPLNDSVTLVSSAPDANQIWIGFASGKIVVYSYKFEGGGSKLEIASEGRRLIGHRSAVLAMYQSRSFSLAVSASQDGSCILWDINNLIYIRSLPYVNLPVTCVTISETLGDIMTAAQESNQSQVRVHSANTRLVGSFSTPSNVTAACYSTAPEGCSVNVLATGTADGQILLWSSWDLTPVGKISAPGLIHPITSITYSFDSQLLYATSSTGTVYVWQSSNAKSNAKLPKFLNLTSLV